MIKQIEGLMTEEVFLKRLEEIVSQRRGEMTVAKLDIDDFETVNRFYGEYVGDQAIKKLAHVLVKNLCRNHLVCRTYKDEFTVLMEETSQETGALIIEEIRAYFDEHLMWVGDPPKEIAIRFSAGIASFPQNGKTVPELLEALDQTMKKAKNTGKNRVLTARSEPWVMKQFMIRQEMDAALHQLSRKLDKTEAGLFREALQEFVKKHEDV